MRLLLQPLLAASLFCTALAATPAWSNEYDIELAVFVHKGVPAQPGAGLESDRGAALDRQLEQWFERTGSVLALPVTVGRMSDLVDRLRASPGYEVIQHTTWREEVKLISEAPFVDVSWSAFTTARCCTWTCCCDTGRSTTRCRCCHKRYRPAPWKTLRPVPEAISWRKRDA